MRYWRRSPQVRNGRTQTGLAQPDSSQILALRQMVRAGNVTLASAEGREILLPNEAATLLGEILENMLAGKAVAVVGEDPEVDTEVAAELLDVPVPFLCQLLQAGEIPYHSRGERRLLALRDVLAHKAKRDRERHEAIGRMARMELEAGTYDTVLIPEGAEER